MILTSPSDWVRPIFIFCKLQFKETDYACKVFKNVTIFISVSGKTLRVWHNRSMLVCVITEQLWTKRVNVQRFLWPVSHGKTLSLASATNKYVSSLSWLWRLMRRSIRNFNIPKQPPWHLNFLRHAWSESSFPLSRGSRWVSHCPTRASFFSLPSFPTIQRGLCGGERSSPYKLPHGSGQMPLPKRKCFANIWCVD